MRWTRNGTSVSPEKGGDVKHKHLPAIRRRNIVAYNMILRGQKAGTHTDKKKAASKMACRGKVKA